MRRRIIEALTYPRMLLSSLMDVSECPMNLYFESTHGACQACEQGTECQWLNHNDEFSVLAQQPMDALFQTFEYSIDYVDAYITRENHRPRRCVCDTCLWLREARQLVREYSNQATAVPRGLST